MRVVAVAVVAVACMAAPHASAQQNQTKTNSANTLKISPIRSDIVVKAGEIKKVPVTITNVTDKPITVTPVLNDFIAGDERGTPALILDADKFAPTHSLKRFMRPLQNLTIEAKKNRTVDVTINVPKSAQAGGYFGAVRFAPTNPDGGGQVNLNASVASIMLVTVPGNVVERLALTEFEIQQGGKSAGNFENPNDLQATFRFHNSGGLQLGPFGKVSVKQGDKVVYAADFNNKDQRDMILPDSARRWDVPLKNIGSFGEYTVVATFSYGTKNETIEVKKSFWVIPKIVIFATIGAVLGLIALIAAIWWFLRSYKRRILRGSGGLGSRRR